MTPPSGVNLPTVSTSGTRVCPTCKGTGVNPVWPTKVCPKCNGETWVYAGMGR